MPYDIEMRTDDTLELDAIIQEWSTPSSAITVNPQGSLSSDSHSLNGFETKTGVFDPDKAGKYEIKINGQILSINVTDASAIPDSVIDSFEDGNINEYSGNTGDFFTDKERTYDGNYALASSSGSAKTITADTSSGLPRTPERGDVFRFSFYITSNGVDIGFRWANETYKVRKRSTGYSSGGGDFELRGPNGNNLDVVKDGDYTVPTDSWGIIEVDFSNPIVGKLYYASDYPDGSSLATVSASDSTSDSGSITIYSNADGSPKRWYDAFYLK